MTTSDNDNPLWSPFVNRLEPYVPGEQPAQENLVKLNTNESPYPPSPAAIAAIQNAAGDSLRLYPDPESKQLKSVIAEYFSTNDCPLAQDNVFVGNGSDEVLAHAFNAFFRQDKPILFPDLTYSFYPVYCQLYDIEYRLMPLDANFQIVVEDYDISNGGIIFPNPNAPTGIALKRQAIIDLLEANPDSTVIVDEAYIDFAESAESDGQADKISSVIDLTSRYNNLLVVHTLSKSRAFAGMRVGYAIGSVGLIAALQRVKNSFNSYPIDRLAEVAAIASFKDEEYFQSVRAKVINNRNSLTESLTALGFNCLPSAANFLLLTHKDLDAKTIAAQLREQNIIVRYFATPRISQFLRISIGSEQENQLLLAAIKTLLA